MTKLWIDDGGEGSFAVVSLTGELWHETVGAAEAHLMERVAGGGAVRLVLDLERLSFLDSAGVSMIAKTVRAVRGVGGTLLLVVPDGTQPRRVLAITGMDHQVRVLDALGKAVAEERPG
ncbi:STAS domain-containing protein [Actinocorallia longicatena]|uniref:Anti-sigma factor antagonist n=1 Tax=Actinocorallia longicatena TaxID=111803 RepID=A0ABP6QDD2_9ACTN